MSLACLLLAVGPVGWRLTTGRFAASDFRRNPDAGDDVDLPVLGIEKMTEKHDSLDLRVLHRPGNLDADGCGKSERFSIDFVVNGRSLYEELAVAGLDLVGRFSPEDREWNQESAAIFLVTRPPDLENGRVMLYVCPECGDIGCGAITVKISKAERTFTWSDFGHENDWGSDRDSYEHVGPFIFDYDEYRRVIEKARNT